MRRAKRVLPMLVVLATAVPAYSQNANLENVISGKTIPLTLKLGDLNAEWRRISLNGQADMSSFMRLMMGTGATSDTYYTKGQTVAVAGESYAIAYRAQIKGPDFMTIMRGGPGAAPPMQEKMTPDTPLTLALLNQRTMGSLIDIRPFNLEQELAANNLPPGAVGGAAAGGAQVQAINAASANNLKQLGLGLMMYAQDNAEILPPMKDAAAFKKAILAYAKNEDLFVHPGTKEAYGVNPQLAGKTLADFQDPAQTIVLYEANAAPDGSRAILYLDGHVKRISGDEEKKFAAELKRFEAQQRAAQGAAPAAQARQD